MKKGFGQIAILFTFLVEIRALVEREVSLSAKSHFARDASPFEASFNLAFCVTRENYARHSCQSGIFTDPRGRRARGLCCLLNGVVVV